MRHVRDGDRAARGPDTDRSEGLADVPVVEPLPLHEDTTSILDDLSQRRGVRQHRDDDPALFEGFGPPRYATAWPRTSPPRVCRLSGLP